MVPPGRPWMLLPPVALALLVAGCAQPGPATQSWVSPSPAEEGPVPETPLSHPGGRWASNTVGVSVGPGPVESVEMVREALRRWENATGGLLRLVEVPGGANITVRFVERLSRPAAEELGDAQLLFVRVGNRTLFQKAEIELLTKSPSGKPLTRTDALSLAIHEVGHALGLGHSASPSSVMSPKLPIPSSQARLPREQDAAPLKAAYGEPARADLGVSILEGSRKTIGAGTYLDLRFQVRNEGLLPASGTLTVEAGGQEVRREDLETLDAGRSLILTLSNLKAPEGFERVAVAVEPSPGTAEYETANNRAEAALG